MEEDWEGQQDVGMEEEEQEEDDGDILDTGEDDQETNDREGLLMRFCPNDSSMLYPQVRSRRRSSPSLGVWCAISMPLNSDFENVGGQTKS